MGLSNLPPGCSDYDIEKAAGAFDEDDCLHCPDCGELTLYHIEDTKPDFTGEYKEVRNCAECDTLVYIIRHAKPVDDDGPPEDPNDGE